MWKLIQRPGGWLIAETALPSGKLLRKRLVFATRGKHLWVSINGRCLECDSCATPNIEPDSEQTFEHELVAQFPGRIKEVLVRDEEVVERGQKLLSIEAMKMGFSIEAPFAGRILKVLVKIGDSVHPGVKFFEIGRLGTTPGVGQ